jgi:hypothetical protein
MKLVEPIYDDDEEIPGSSPGSKAPIHIEAEPWWRNPATIPKREFLYGKHYMRKAIGASIGAGGRRPMDFVSFRE